MEIKVATHDYDYLHPLAMGRIDVEGQSFAVDLGADLRRAVNDDQYHVVELSWSRHIQRLAKGDRSWVAIPLFVRRAFSHRTWYVRSDSDYLTYSDLSGAVIGTNEWPATGNTWGRAAARSDGLNLESCRWLVGSVEGGPFGADDSLPEHVSHLASDDHLVNMLLDGQIAAIVNQLPPSAMYSDTAPVRRLLNDYVGAEREFYHATRIYPAHHVMGVREDVFRTHPQILETVYQVFERSRLWWQAQRFKLCDTSPWLLADMEWALAHMGSDWPRNGTSANSHVSQYLCDELLAQGLIMEPLNPLDIFEEFDSVVHLDELGRIIS